MAYKPPVVPPKRSKSREARAAAQAAVRRTALAKALRERLLELIASTAAGRGQADTIGRPMFREEPIRPPEPPFRTEPIPFPRVPPRGTPHLPPDGFFPPGRGGPVFDPQTARPPSIADWTRQPGFFAEDRAPMGPVEEDGSFVVGGGLIFDPDLGGFRASGRPTYF